MDSKMKIYIFYPEYLEESHIMVIAKNKKDAIRSFKQSVYRNWEENCAYADWEDDILEFEIKKSVNLI